MWIGRGRAAGLFAAVIVGALGFTGCGNVDPSATSADPGAGAARSPAGSSPAATSAPAAAGTPIATGTTPAAAHSSPGTKAAAPRSPADTSAPAAADAPGAVHSPAAARSPVPAVQASRAQASPQSTPSAGPFSLGSGWKTAVDATFTGSRLDTSLWATCYPWASPAGCTNFGNAEYEWYLPGQVQVSGGALHLVARRTPTQGLARGGGAETYAYRSGMITGFRYQYGYTQVVARIPYGPGLWPALWLAAANEKWPPEIDILEHWDTEAQYSEHLHAADMSVQWAAESAENLSVGWHTFGLYWSPSQLIWYIDGHQVMSAVSGVPRQSMYFLANLAVDAQNPAGWKDGASLDIQSVTVWQAASYRNG